MTYYLGAALVAAGFLFQSCDDDDHYSLGDMGVDWATVKVEGAHTYSLDGDTWGSLWPAATSIPGYSPVDGQRVIAYFNPLGDDFQGYDHAVKMEGVREILTKRIERMDGDAEADYGDDPIVILKDNMWMGGGYLNIVFEQNLPLEVKHRISLVHTGDLKPDAEGYVNLELRYNTYGDTSDHWARGAVSFSLNALEDLDDLKGIRVILNSRENGKVEVPFELIPESAPQGARDLDFSEMELY